MCHFLLSLETSVETMVPLQHFLSPSVSAQQNMTEQMNQLSVLVAVLSQGGHLRN